MRSHFCGDGLNIRARKVILVVIAAAGLLLSGCSSSMEQGTQCYYTAKAMQHSLPACETFMLNVDTKDGNRLDIYFKFPTRVFISKKILTSSRHRTPYRLSCEIKMVRLSAPTMSTGRLLHDRTPNQSPLSAMHFLKCFTFLPEAIRLTLSFSTTGAVCSLTAARESK